MTNRKAKILALLAFWFCSGVLPALAADDDGEINFPGKSKARLPVGSQLQEYDQIVSPDMETAGSLANRARVALTNGNYKRALYLAKLSLKKDDDDPDTHAIYAASIEANLEHQTEKDPELFKTCIHEWLLVYRNETGEEKNMTIKGLNIMGTFWNDDFRGGLARKHIKKLTGYLPRAWETDNRFLARVMKPAETRVSGELKAGNK